MSKNYRPLPDCLTIQESSIDGLGLYAKEDLNIEQNLGITHHQSDDGLIRTPLGGFYNHSKNPNCERIESENNTYSLVTIKPIKSGEELTVKYELYNPTEEDKTEWNDNIVIDFVNWYIEANKLPFRYTLENQYVIESFKNGENPDSYRKSQLFETNQFEIVLDDINTQLNKIIYDGDLSDIGNEIGLVISKYISNDKLGYDLDAFISGLKHGINN